MISKDIADKLALVVAELTQKYAQRDAIYSNLSALETRIKLLEDIKSRLEQADAALKGIQD